jgi:hypothetical protein
MTFNLMKHVTTSARAKTLARQKKLVARRRSPEEGCKHVHISRRGISASRNSLEDVVEGACQPGAAGICDVCALFRSLTVPDQASKLAWK